MTEFNQWGEIFYFSLFFAPIILVPCALVALIGRKVIDKIGLHPTKTPAIQMGMVWWLILIELVTFALLIAFYLFFI